MSDIKAVVDLGKSSTKVIWSQSADERKHLLFLEPEIVSLTAEDIGTAIRENADPEKDAWLTWPDGTGEALGFVSRTTRYRNRRVLSKDELKSIHGSSRCLAVIGAIAERVGLTRHIEEEITEFSLSLSVLLPLSEWSTCKDFQAELLNHLESGFVFRDRKYRVKVDLLDLKPEGLGLLMRRQLQLPKEVYRSRTFLCLMMGQYNNTLYLYQGGQKLVQDCSSNGFHEIVDAVIAQTALDSSVVASNDLIKAIFQARLGNPSLIKELLWQKVKDPIKLQQQVVQVQQVIEKVGTEQWSKITRWFDNCLGTHRFNINEVLPGGGTSRLFKEELTNFFHPCDILWSCQLNQLVAREFGYSNDDPMSHRLADPYSISDWLTQITRQKQSIA